MGIAMMIGMAAMMACMGLMGVMHHGGHDADQHQATVQQAAGTADSASANTYPLDYCVVSGQKLGSMGDPVVKTHDGREVRFCCGTCVKEFEQNPEAYLKMLDAHSADSDRH